jgi:hypothetical protein
VDCPVVFNLLILSDEQEDDQHLEDEGESALKDNSLKVLGVGTPQERHESDAIDVFIELHLDEFVCPVDRLLHLDIIVRVKTLTLFNLDVVHDIVDVDSDLHVFSFLTIVPVTQLACDFLFSLHLVCVFFQWFVVFVALLVLRLWIEDCVMSSRLLILLNEVFETEEVLHTDIQVELQNRLDEDFVIPVLDAALEYDPALFGYGHKYVLIDRHRKDGRASAVARNFDEENAEEDSQQNELHPVCPLCVNHLVLR